MIGDLSNDLYRLMAVYRNRAKLFNLNGRKPVFSIRDAIRHHLFAKAESSGFTPIPNYPFYEWTLDLLCFRGAKLEYVFVVRESRRDDYRQLLLFPQTIERVLIAMTVSSIPDDHEKFTVIRVPRRPTQSIGAALSVNQIIDDYMSAFHEVYGFMPNFSKAQLVGAAGKVSAFWMSQAYGLNFRDFCVWFMANRQANRTNQEFDRVTQLNELRDKSQVIAFKHHKEREESDSEWTQGGWESLDTD